MNKTGSAMGNGTGNGQGNGSGSLGQGGSTFTQVGNGLHD